jgi:exonuclease III
MIVWRRCQLPRKPRSKRAKRLAQSYKQPGQEAEWPRSKISEGASPCQTNHLIEDCLDGSTVIDPLAPLTVAQKVDDEEMEAQSEPVAEPETVSSSLSGADNPQNIVAESTVDSVSPSPSGQQCTLSLPQDIPLPEEATLNEDSSNIEPLALCDLRYDFESDHSGSDIESLSGASTISSLQLAADLIEYLLQNDGRSSCLVGGACRIVSCRGGWFLFFRSLTFNLLSLNVNGLSDRLKRTALVDWLKCMRVDFACLQETHASSHESIRKWFCNSGFKVVSSSVSNKSCGTAIIVRDTHKVNKVIRDEEGHFVQVHLEADEHLLSFVSLYAPNKNPDRNWFVSSVPERIDLSRPTFICGDFNSVLDSALDRKRRSSYTGSQAAQYQESGPALQSLLSATQTYPLWQTSRSDGLFLDSWVRAVCFTDQYGLGPHFLPRQH